MLLSCRTFYADIHPILYSTNLFHIRHKDKGNLDRLLRLRPQTIALLRHLEINLNDSYLYDHWLHSPVERHFEDNKGSPPLNNSRQAILSNWRRVARCILPFLKPNALHLSLLCDSANLETAAAVVQPLLSAPTLANCRLRLAPEPNFALQNLARKVSKLTTGYEYPGPELPFRFLDLPKELRLQILQYTDLVAPSREVEWSSEKKFTLRLSSCTCKQYCCSVRERPCCPSLRPSCQFRACWHVDGPGAGCFCQNYHAAFSTRYTCWAPPKCFFLVCKQFLEDSREIFYGNNRFVIVAPGHACTQPVSDTPSRLDISVFLRDVVLPSSMKSLRSLDIVVPAFYYDYLRSDEPAYPDWLSTIDYMGTFMNLSVLKLRVSMSDIILEHDFAEYTTSLGKGTSQTIVNAYGRLIGPLSKLREQGLRRFFVSPEVCLPWHRTEESVRLYDKRSAYDENVQCAWEEERTKFRLRFERLVMGGSYDSKGLEEQVDEAQWENESYEPTYYE